jgi:catechol 2,3-dioxygenase-like lactoylglutathione lyase family enzyme
MNSDGTVSVRYRVDDLSAAVDFYTAPFGFTGGINAPPVFPDVTKGRLRLLLAGAGSSGGRPMDDGERPHPGGGNHLFELFQPASPAIRT